MDKKGRLKKPKVRTVGHQEKRVGVSREPIQAALGETAHQAPSREVGKEGLRGG